MPSSKRPQSSRDKVRAHRERLRAQGLRPIQIWVPDVRVPGFAEEMRRQSRAIANSEQDHEDMDFVESVLIILEQD